MSAPGFEVAPIFGVRMAGVSFDVLKRLATAAASERARAILALEADLAQAAASLMAEMSSMTRSLGSLGAQLRRSVRDGLPITDDLLAAVQREAAGALPALVAYHAAGADLVLARTTLDHELSIEYGAAARAVIESSLAQLRAYAVFSSDDLTNELDRLAHDEERDQFDNKERKTIQHLALYLQRVCAKTDTISRFGPAGWGTVDDGDGFRVSPQPGVQRRQAYLERWVARVVAAAMNADPAVRPELSPRVHPNGRLEGATFVRLDTDAEIALRPEELLLLDRLDAATPAFQLADQTGLESLAERGVVVWQVELVAMDTQPTHTLLDDVRRWRESDARARWQPVLEQLIAAPAQLEADPDPGHRTLIMKGVGTLLQEIGGALPQRSRTLYSAFNPIVEECYRDCEVRLGRRMVDQVVTDAEPWLDLWRDTFSLAASHAYGSLAELHRAAPRRGGELSLPAFLAYCEKGNRNLRGAALAQLAAESYQQVKSDLRDALAGRDDAPEWELTTEDCHVLRRRHVFPLVDEFSWPSADLQLSASSTDTSERGDYDWVIGELHHGGPLLQHGIYWSCPDRPLVRDFVRRWLGGKPWCAHSHGHFELPVHISSEPAMDAMEAAVFVAPERGKPVWRCVAPSDAVVVIDEEQRDIRARHRDTGEDLGSLVRQLFLCMGFHPFFPLAIAPHTPRLRLGKVIVQRRTWYVTRAELGGGPFRGVSRDLVLAVERLRAARDLPRWVYVRPSAAGLQRANFLARDKDLKPIYIDLESYIFAAIFAKRLEKYAELEVVEMLPDPDHMAWREDDGARVFELRTMVYAPRDPAPAR